VSTFQKWARGLDSLPENIGKNPGITKGPWDYVVLGGQVVPGVAIVDVSMGTGLDIQKPKGGKRATIVDDGDPPAEVEIKLLLQSDDMEAFRDFIMPILREPGKNGGRQPLEISHPNCELWGIDTIAVGNISSPSPQSGGLMTITINATEWVAAPEPVKAPTKVLTNDGAETPYASSSDTYYDPNYGNAGPAAPSYYEPAGSGAAPTADDIFNGGGDI
jgi:hypothetical protein